VSGRRGKPVRFDHPFIFEKNARRIEMSVQNITEKATFLTFTLNREIFAIQVANVREVLDLAEITVVPRTPKFMRGVINLRGRVVPVVDMRIKFDLPAVQDTVDTCIIVVEVNFDDEKMVIGALADSVEEVFELGEEEIEPPPSIGSSLDSEFIRGMGKLGEKFIVILDIDKVFSVDELAMATDPGEVDPAVLSDIKTVEPVEEAVV